MEHYLAYCGLSCATCAVHLATGESDEVVRERMRESISEECRSNYGLNLHASDIGDCDGCRADDTRIFKGCLDCEIRKCARKRQLESCAFCPDYVCEKLRKQFEIDPDAPKRLDELLHSGWK